MKYRKKPVVVEAVQFDGTEDSIVKIMALTCLLGGNVTRQIDVDCGGKVLWIHTPEGTMECSLNDFVIRGVKGEVYPCKPDIFAATYEKVNQGEQEK